MDGNGRWATARGLPRCEGHRAGATAARRVIEAAPNHGVRTLTLYAFSADNWARPWAEVGPLMALLERYLRSECERCARDGVRISVIGRRDRIGRGVQRAIDAAEEATREGRALHVRLAVDYSGRESIVMAAQRSAATREAVGRELGEDVDLLIRTGGEQRLSDFLLWESAYAELVFSNKLWPDFGAADLEEAVRVFSRRDRRFGGLGKPPLGESFGRDEARTIRNGGGARWLR